MMIELVDVRLDHPRGGPPLVTGANLKVEGGEVVVIVGAAGVGTSRIAAAALGEVPLAEGKIELLGRDVTKLRRSSLRLLRRRIGIVPQDLCLLEDRSVQINTVLPLEIDGIPRSVSRARGDEMLSKLALAGDSELEVHQLSASARQRVAVARALIREPAVVLADHPTSMQDAEGTELVVAALLDAASRGAAIVVCSRDPGLRAIAERRHWRQLALVDGSLRPLAEVAVDGRSIDDILIDMDSQAMPLHAVPDPELANIVPFPRSDSRPVAESIARTAGVR
ncbi:MAG: ATP-binding cassette domain-containing protein [Kofleriaceae bacterium]